MGVRLLGDLSLGADFVSGAEFLRYAWVWEPSVVLGCVAVGGVYLRYGGATWWRRSAFIGGLALLLVALVSPLDVLADEYLFSAHMTQHLILVLLVSSLLVLGIPRAWAAGVERIAARSWLGRALAHPLLAWILSVATMVAWHVPALYDLSVRNEFLHVVQHLTFLGASTLFWWIAIDPAAGLDREPRLAPWLAVVYLFAASAAGSVLGIVLTFSPTLLYSAYIQPHDEYGILTALRERLSLTPQGDQQLGGVLMWVVGGSFYLLPIVAVFARWMSQTELDTSPVEFSHSASEWSA